MPIPNEHPNRLVVFTRYPKPGKVKTRLIPVLGERRAAELHQEMTEHTLAIADRLAAQGTVRVEVHHEGGTAEMMTALFGEQRRYVPQQAGADLGARMVAAFRRGLEQGAKKVVVVGTDCPGLSTAIIERAFDALDQASLVLGPAFDGGYYLIGLTKEIPWLFEEIPWGTPEVFVTTRDRARQIDLPTAILTPLHDIDRPEDLPVWESAFRRDGVV